MSKFLLVHKHVETRMGRPSVAVAYEINNDGSSVLFRRTGDMLSLNAMIGNQQVEPVRKVVTASM